MGFPLEIITTLVSAVLSAYIKYKSKQLDAKQAETEMAIKRDEQMHKLRTIKQSGFQWTRRVIAIASIFSIVVLPKLAVLFGWTDVTVTFGWTEMQGWWIFAQEGWEWKTVEGMVITPLDTHVVSAIVGLYFGGSLVDHGRR